jgi:nucleoside-diphosphate-sugar epimerase
MSIKVLVVGSADVTSQAICQRLLANADFELLNKGDVAPLGALGLKTLLTDAQAVVNVVNGSPAYIDACTEQLAAALGDLKRNNLQLVQLSSMTVYGPVEGRVDERAPLGADLSPYASARLRAERHLAAGAPQITLLRLGVEYGLGCTAWTERVARLLMQRRLGDMGALGDGRCNLVHLEDVALSVERALLVEAAKGQAFNIAAPNPPTWNEYLIRFGLLLGATPIRRVGARRLRLETKVLAIPLKLIEILLSRRVGRYGGIAPPITRSLLQSLQQDVVLDSAKADRILGMQWQKLEPSLCTIVEHLQERKA